MVISILITSAGFGQVWVQKGADIDGPTPYDQSGNSVSMSANGSVIAIGAWRAGNDLGLVRVYEWNAGSWVQKGGDINGTVIDDYMGSSVSISADGNTLIAGASGSGYTRVFEWDGLVWVQKGADIIGEEVDDSFGSETSISDNGNVVAVGAPLNDGTGVDAGHVRVFDWSGGQWVQRGTDIDGDAEQNNCGWSLSLSANGDVIGIGSHTNDNATGIEAGHTRVYQWVSSDWVQMGDNIEGEAPFDHSGRSVSLNADGSIVAIGADLNDADVGFQPQIGHVRVYEWTGSIWTQKGGDIDGQSNSEWFGYSVELSDDGNTLVASAPNALGIGQSVGTGITRIYQWNGTDWVQKGGDINAEAHGDFSGWSVSMSSDGSLVCIGGLGNDGNGGSSGHTRVFEYTSTVDMLDHSLSNQAIIWPNPSSGLFKVNGKGRITIHNSMGQLIMSEEAAGNTAINLSDQADGIYVVQLQTKKATLRGKLVKH
jgi:hypothetical protein